MLSIDISFLVVFALIWILLAVLTKLFFNPLRKVVEKRNSNIDQDREAGETAALEYNQAIQKIEEDMKAARASARKTREELTRHAQKEKEKMLAEISSECRTSILEARNDVAKQLDGLKKELESMSTDLAEKIEKKLLDK